MRKTRIHSGDRYGQLTVVEETDGMVSGGENKHQVLCRCDCGTEKVIRLDLLRNGKARTCGCRQRMTHGETGTYTYSTWVNMKDRCRNPHSPDYPRYGGRGVHICERWLDFAAFLEDMGERPSCTTLDRIDNNGDYEPCNCRWATKKEQGRNRRNNRTLTHDGETLCLSEWAERLNVVPNTIKCRLASGWSIDDAVTVPSGGSRNAS